MTRILISAYGCEPDKGSEQGVGWNWVMQIARSAEVVVITRRNNQTAIERSLQASLRSRVKFKFYDLPPILLRFKHKTKRLYPYYVAWQCGAYLLARRLVAERAYDYVIALTFGSVWLPTFMHLLAVPFIWGPVGGGESVPTGLRKALPRRTYVGEVLRLVLKKTVPFNPLIAGPAKRARAILARTDDTAALFAAKHAMKTHVILESAIPEEIFAAGAGGRIKRQARCLRVIYSGRLVPIKNVQAAIRAIFGVIKLGFDVELTVLGDGPDRAALEQLARQFGVQKNVHFHGEIAQQCVVQKLKEADVFLFPSLKEGGTWSLLEAMTVGLPIICVKSSGMAVITDDTCAFRIEPISDEQIVSGFTAALKRIGDDPLLGEEMGRNSRDRIERHFRWAHKGDFFKGLLLSMKTTEG